ncbi:creatininase family protein [Rhizobium rhizosphaerae]|uniref:creatininase family protein n=1 Tax=Xaviernesmea rhizosphaerae TaxID=1672749 RepID=UPI00098FB068|nr:creatininase family protein [Xaviernesmea rhizosphaerae]
MPHPSLLPVPEVLSAVDWVAAGSAHGPIAVLPLGAYEQHGPHLPFATDSLIAAGLVARLKGRVAAAGLHVGFLPVEPIGYSIEHGFAPGTRSLEHGEAIERWLAIAEALQAQGVDKLLMLNAHGGNAPLMTIVATEARVRFSTLAVATHWLRFGVPEGWMTPQDKAIDIHAGEIETAMMLALHPELVDRDKASDFPSRQRDFAARFTHLRAYGPHAFGWTMADLNPEGAAGNAAAATAEKGEALIDHAVQGLLELLTDIDAFDPAEFT